MPPFLRTFTGCNALLLERLRIALLREGRKMVAETLTCALDARASPGHCQVKRNNNQSFSNEKKSHIEGEQFAIPLPIVQLVWVAHGPLCTPGLHFLVGAARA